MQDLAVGEGVVVADASVSAAVLKPKVMGSNPARAIEPGDNSRLSNWLHQFKFALRALCIAQYKDTTS